MTDLANLRTRRRKTTEPPIRPTETFFAVSRSISNMDPFSQVTVRYRTFMSSVNLSGTGPGETVLPADPESLVEQLHVAQGLHGSERHAFVSQLCAKYPSSSLAWATLGDNARDDVEAYAAYRVGYHRGLDALRANGWKGSGYVRWDHESNRGFLRCLDGLASAAGRIGEVSEAARCSQFALQLDPRGSRGESH